MKAAIVLLITVLIIFASSILWIPGKLNTHTNDTPDKDIQKKQVEPISVNESADIKDEISKLAQEIIVLIKDKDFAQIAKYVHSNKGLLFAPYVFIDKEHNVIFDKKDLGAAWNNNKIINWGIFDGSGFPIELTFAEYYKRFIYNADFIAAPEQNFDKSIHRGATRNNVKEAFPNTTSYEFYIPDKNPSANTDWKSLILIFEKIDDKWYLRGIVHDQWTI